MNRARSYSCYSSTLRADMSSTTGAALPKIMKPPQCLPLQMAERAKRLLRAQPDSIANHVTDRSISNRRALT